MRQRGVKGPHGPKGRGGLLELARGGNVVPLQDASPRGARGGGAKVKLAIAGALLCALLGAAAWWALAGGRAAPSQLALPTTPEGRYRLELATLRPIEEEAVASLAAVTGPSYVDDERLAKALRDRTLPAWASVIAGLGAIAPPEPVATLHARLVAAARAEATALGRIATALEHGDGVAVQLANVDHQAARAELDAVAAALAVALSPRR